MCRGGGGHVDDDLYDVYDMRRQCREVGLASHRDIREWHRDIGILCVPYFLPWVLGQDVFITLRIPWLSHSICSMSFIFCSLRKG